MSATFIPDQTVSGYEVLRALRAWEKKRDPEGYQRRFARSTAGRRLRNQAKK